MSTDAVWMNFWSVAVHVCPCALRAPEQPLETATRTSVAAMTPNRRKMATTSARRTHSLDHSIQGENVAIATTRR